MLNTDCLYHYPGFFSVRDENLALTYVNQQLSDFLHTLYPEATSFIGFTDQQLAHKAPSALVELFRLVHESNLICLQQDEPHIRLIPFDYNGKHKVFNVVKYRLRRGDDYYIYSFTTCVTELYDQLLRTEAESKLDQLSQLYNRKYLANWRPHLNKTPIFVLLDLDHFKGVNDYFGHEAGDNVIVQFSSLLRLHFPRQDLVRFGGDEFLVIAYESEASVRRALSNLLCHFSAEFSCYPFLSFSFGCSPYVGTLRTTLSKIDKAMYANKRNRESETQYLRRLDLAQSEI